MHFNRKPETESELDSKPDTLIQDVGAQAASECCTTHPAILKMNSAEVIIFARLCFKKLWLFADKSPEWLRQSVNQRSMSNNKPVPKS